MGGFKLILIGDANHQYIQHFTAWLRITKQNLHVTIITFHPVEDQHAVQQYFDECFEIKPNPDYISRRKGLRTFMLAWKVFALFYKQKLFADTILVHFIRPELAYVGNLLRKRSSNYSVALWGSDFYRTTAFFSLRLNFKMADNIIIGSPQVIDDFSLKFHCYLNKVHLCYFGTEPIEQLRKLKENSITKHDSADFFHLSRNKINIMVGYNGSRAHNHIAVLNQLNQLDDVTKQGFRVLLPMTYGLEESYLDEIKSLISSVEYESVTFISYMNEVEVANMRNMTDIMINVQTTDAYSGSMREVLYCGGVVINGSWLPYQFLKKMGLYYEEIEKIEDLSDVLPEILMNYSAFSKRCERNESLIYESSSWSRTIDQWKKTIELRR
jgi:hypothetical protein